MLWLKALHIVFMVTWFAGLFYLPRLFVYHADCVDEPGHQRLCTMETRLFAIMTLGAVLTLVFGVWLLVGYWLTALPNAGWLHAKLALVALLVAYHGGCWAYMRAFRARRNRRPARWFRWFNEIPGVLLVAIVLLAVVKP
ncbi:MAG: CopD family protein [Gammaproteobacteria bacterium]